MAKSINEGVSIIVPTFRRPDGLKAALDSLIGQTANGLPKEVIVADNDPNAGAKSFVQKYARTAPYQLIYIHVPEPGVSNARNAALAKARGRYLVFLDDDQVAMKSWLNAMIDAAQNLQAALMFGPTLARIPGQSKYQAFLQKYFSRIEPSLDEGLIDTFYGCGNSLLDTHLCELPDPAFDPALNETGGEDDRLFGIIQRQGVKIGWSKAAAVYEDIRPHRASVDYIRVRSFANGQGPSQHAHDVGDWPSVVKWMVIGAGQFAVFKPVEGFCDLLGLPAKIHYMSKAAEGAGKFLWFERFTPKLYGAAVVENTAF